MNCHICGAENLNLLLNYNSLPRVASDCVPWPSGGRLAVCTVCGCVQNPVDDDWKNETAKVYSQYKIYKQSSGSEQGVFTGGTHSVPRSAKIFEKAKPFLKLKKKGRLLDIGCANGELLRCFASMAPEWNLVGFEIDNKRKEEVESIPSVEQFAWGSIDNVKGTFDIITLIHVFEHLPFPKEWLENLKKFLNPDGVILIQVPDPMKNPYNLLVADHCSHFLMADLIYIANQTGYNVIAASDDWIARELTLIMTPNLNNVFDAVSYPNTRFSNYPSHAVAWLHKVMNMTSHLNTRNKIGIWGTAIAATWFYSLVKNHVAFFVDEDTTRIGQKHLNLPIYHPEEIPSDSQVFIALTPEIADNIQNRWSHLPIKLFLPPPLIY